RLVSWLLLILLAARAAAFLTYAFFRLGSPVETYHLESFMAHLAWRVEHGLSLYPDWRQGPYVANYFAPLYLSVVGLIGRGVGASLDQLFFIGRSVTFAAVLVTPLIAARTVSTGRRS